MASSSTTKESGDSFDSKPRIWEDFGHQFAAGELEDLKKSIADMALSRINGHDELYVGGYVSALVLVSISTHLVVSHHNETPGRDSPFNSQPC